LAYFFPLFYHARVWGIMMISLFSLLKRINFLSFLLFTLFAGKKSGCECEKHSKSQFSHLSQCSAGGKHDQDQQESKTAQQKLSAQEISNQGP